MRLLFFCIALILSFNLFGQEKYEREYRISDTEVPVVATAFVDEMGFKKKVKWYLEESFTGESLEAKARKNNRYYSIEFDKSGQLQDVEIKIAVNKLPDDFRSGMFAQLDEYFERVFKIVKIQEQFSGDSDSVLHYLLTGEGKNKIIQKYEVVLSAKTEQQSALFECTFSETGQLEQRRRIILTDTDNLEF